MATFGELVTRVADETTRPELASQIRLAIKQAIKFYERRRFWFTDQRMSLVTDAGTALYPLTLDRVDAVFMTDTAGTWQLRRCDQQWLERVDGAGTSYTGEPTDWGIQGQYLRLSPTPNGAYALIVHGHRPLPELSADDDSNVWTTLAEDLIVARAKSRLYADVIREDFGDTTIAAAQEKEALASLIAQGNRQGPVGVVRPSWL